MTPARNLQLFPDKATKPRTRREKGTYGLIDNPVIAYQKKNGAADTRLLAALAEASNYHRSLSLPQLMIETDLSESAVRKTMPKLIAAGFCKAEGKAWRYQKTDSNPDRNPDGCPEMHPKNTVQDGISETPKEVEGSRRKFKRLKTNNIFLLNLGWITRFAPTAVGGGAAEKNLESVTSEQQAPDGAASSEASTDNPSHSQVKNVSSEEKNENAPESETVPPAAPPALAPPETYREAQEVLSSAGFWDVWQKWVKSHRLSRAAQDLQIIDFAVWVQVGLGEILRQHAHEITKLGSFGHPFAGLQGRMQAALAVKKTEQHNAAEVVRVFGVPQCQAGERRRDPATGKVWTVEEIAYGMVIFEEGAAPMNAADVTVAGWEVAG